MFNRSVTCVWGLLLIFLHCQDSLFLMRGWNFSERIPLLCLRLPLPMALLIFTTVKFPQHIPVVTLKDSCSPANDFVWADQSCLKSEAIRISVVVKHIYSAHLHLVLNQVQAFIIMLSRGIWKRCWYLLAVDTRWVIQSGADGKLILNNDKPGLLHHSWFSCFIGRFTIWV